MIGLISRMVAVLKVIVLAAAVFGITKCQEKFDFKITAMAPIFESKLMEQKNRIFSVLECARVCSLACSCDFVQYCKDGGTCALYEKGVNCTANFASCSNGKPPITVSLIQPDTPASSTPPSVCDVNNYLVTGPDGVADNQLSASSFWCENLDPWCVPPDSLSAKHARLNQAGYIGSWTPADAEGTTAHIQVDFLTIRLTTGIVLNSRAPPVAYQYTTAFKVLYSRDCVCFTHVQDDSCNDKIFVGSSFEEDLVTRMFEQPIPARCIRINPISWVAYPSLRFDVLGC